MTAQSRRLYSGTTCLRDKFLSNANTLAARSVDFEWRATDGKNLSWYSIAAYLSEEDIAAIWQD